MVFSFFLLKAKRKNIFLIIFDRWQRWRPTSTQTLTAARSVLACPSVLWWLYNFTSSLFIMPFVTLEREICFFLLWAANVQHFSKKLWMIFTSFRRRNHSTHCDKRKVLEKWCNESCMVFTADQAPLPLKCFWLFSCSWDYQALRIWMHKLQSFSRWMCEISELNPSNPADVFFI